LPGFVVCEQALLRPEVERLGWRSDFAYGPGYDSSGARPGAR